MAKDYDKGCCWNEWDVFESSGGLVARKRRRESFVEQFGLTRGELGSRCASWHADQP